MYIHTRNSVFRNTHSTVDFHWFNGSSNLHSHTYYELFIVVKGEFTHNYMGKEISLSSGDAVLIIPNHEHLLLAKTQHDVHANISITEQAFKSLTKTYNTEFYEFLNQTSGQPFHLNTEELSFLVKSLNSTYAMDNAIALDYYYLSILHFIFGLFISKKNDNISELQIPDWLKDFLNTLSSPSVFCLPLKEIYSLSNYSQSRFIYLFKHYMNIPPISYINNLKINYSKKLLTQTNYDLLFISNEVGFSSYSYFATFFKKNVGLSPSEYREKSYKPINRSL